MHVKMKYCLTCRLFIILYNIVPVASQHIRHLLYHFLCKNDRLGGKLFIDVIQIPVMLFRNDQRMSF